MRTQTMVIGLIQAALLMACENRSKSDSQAARDRSDVPASKAASPVALGAVGRSTVSEREAGQNQASDPWSRAVPFDAASRLIVRTGQAGIEVDSLERSMA